MVSTFGGAICADGSDILTISGCTFTGNEAGTGAEGEMGAGGDIYAISGVTLTVNSSNFTKSIADYGGAAIECCGATINSCQFTATESAMDTVSHHSCYRLRFTQLIPCTAVVVWPRTIDGP